MFLPEFGVKRPVTNLMIFCAIIIIAFYSFTRLGVDMMPEIEPPVISVVSFYPGASAEDVEIKVTEPLENQLATTPGLEKITSRSMEGFSIVSLKFQWGTNLDEASNDIRDRIELAKRVLPDIPDEMDTPFIFKFNTALMPIMYMGITAEQSYTELYDILDKRVGDALRQLPGVGTVQLFGGLERQINIWVDKDRLKGYGISILDISAALKNQNVTQPVGNIKSGLTDYVLRLPGEFATPREIDLVMLGQIPSPYEIDSVSMAKNNWKYFYLKDLARIEDGFKEQEMYVRINKRPGMMMIVQKQTGTNTVEVAERVKKRVEELKKTLPADINIFTIFDTSRDIISSLNTLKQTVWFGITLVIVVIWFFLRRFLPSLVVALTIPFSLLISFIYLFLNGKTMNVISLSAIAIAAGMVVDNAIVVVDNISRHVERGERPQEAAIFGTSEIFLAIAASTMTTVVVFMSMLFITGVVGIMFGELAAIIIVTLVASLFTASTFTPMLCSKWIKVNRQTAVESRRKARYNRFYNFSENIFLAVEKLYSKALGWCLGHKSLVIVFFLAAFIFSMTLMRFVGNEFIPEEDSGDVRLTINLTLGTRLEETDRVAKRVEDILRQYAPEAKFIFARSGETSGMGRVMGGSAGKHVIIAGVKLVPKTERNRSAREIAQVLRTEIMRIPGIAKMDISTGNPLGRLIIGGAGKSIQIDVMGNSFQETDAVALAIKSIMEKTPGAVDASISRELNRPELQIDVDREKAATLGLDISVISNSLKTFISGSTATKYREKGETYDIFVRLEEKDRSHPEDIENLTIVSPLTGEQILLSNIAAIKETKGPVEIERQNRERVVRVECNTYQRSAGKVKEDIEKQLKKLPVPSGVMIGIGGEAEEQQKAFKDLALLLLLGVFLVYMVMAAQFESLLDPFIVMFAIPFTFTGVIVGFFLTRTTLSVITFFGIVMLMGIVVNNAIVLISYINILRARGYSMLEAVTQGGRDRLRAVLMTTITTLVGLLPMALYNGEGSEQWQPLGITMISGLSLSTLVTLIFVPTMYAIFEKGKRAVTSN